MKQNVIVRLPHLKFPFRKRSIPFQRHLNFLSLLLIIFSTKRIKENCLSPPRIEPGPSGIRARFRPSSGLIWHRLFQKSLDTNCGINKAKERAAASSQALLLGQARCAWRYRTGSVRFDVIPLNRAAPRNESDWQVFQVHFSSISTGRPSSLFERMVSLWKYY